MIDQEFTGAGGFKVRAIEAEASGGLVEVDLRAFKQTADGTYLIPSKDLQGAGKWAFTLDVAQAKKEGKPVSPEDEKGVDKVVLLLNDIMAKIPEFVKSVKGARPNPMEKGLDIALQKTVEQIAGEVLESDQAIKERLREMVQDALETNILGEQEGGQEGA